MAKVGRPPVLRRGHHRDEVFLEGRQVELLELLGVVERLAHGIGQGRVLVQYLQAQLIGPPVPIGPGLGCPGAIPHVSPIGHRAFGFGRHMSSNATFLDARSLHAWIYFQWVSLLPRTAKNNHSSAQPPEQKRQHTQRPRPKTILTRLPPDRVMMSAFAFAGCGMGMYDPLTSCMKEQP